MLYRLAIWYQTGFRVVWLRTHVSLTLLTYIQKNACILAEILDHIKTKQRTAVILSLEGTLSNLDGNVNDDGSEKSPFWISSFTSLCGSLRFCFFALNFVNRKMNKCYSMKLTKYWESFCCYVFVVSTTLKKVFLRCNFSDVYVQVLSSVHSNVLLLYLLLYLAVVVGVAVAVFDA